MRRYLLLILLIFVGCDNLIKSEDNPDEKSDLDIARENIVGNWHTQNPPKITYDAGSWTDSLHLTFDDKYFNLSAYYLNKSQNISWHFSGEYALDSDSTLVVEIKNIIGEFDWRIKLENNKTYFWDIRALTELRLELCFEPINQNTGLYNYYYYFTHP